MFPLFIRGAEIRFDIPLLYESRVHFTDAEIIDAVATWRRLRLAAKMAYENARCSLGPLNLSHLEAVRGAEASRQAVA
jgi:hypothetical protein